MYYLEYGGNHTITENFRKISVEEAGAVTGGNLVEGLDFFAKMEEKPEAKRPDKNLPKKTMEGLAVFGGLGRNWP